MKFIKNLRMNGHESNCFYVALNSIIPNCLAWLPEGIIQNVVFVAAQYSCMKWGKAVIVSNYYISLYKDQAHGFEIYIGLSI